jgi:hypothetical protein
MSFGSGGKMVWIKALSFSCILVPLEHSLHLTKRLIFANRTLNLDIECFTMLEMDN